MRLLDQRLTERCGTDAAVFDEELADLHSFAAVRKELLVEQGHFKLHGVDLALFEEENPQFRFILSSIVIRGHVFHSGIASLETASDSKAAHLP